MDNSSNGWAMKAKIGSGFGVAFLTLLVIGIGSYYTIDGLEKTASWVARTHHVLEHLSALHYNVEGIDASARSYVLTRGESYLEQYRESSEKVRANAEEIGTLIVDPDQRRRFEALEPLLRQRIGQAQSLVELYEAGGADPSVGLVRAERGKQLTDEIHRLLDGMEDGEQALLGQRRQAAQSMVGRAKYALVTGSVLCALLLTAAGLIISRDLEREKKAEKALFSANEKLLRSVAELEQHTMEIGRLSEMGSYLHSCQTAGEAYHVIAQCVPRILPSLSGCLAVLGTSRNVVEVASTWGEPKLAERVFSPEDCWALRRGRASLVQSAASALQCRHLGKTGLPVYLCLPLMAQGEAIGLLHLQGQPDVPEGGLSENRQKLAGTVADQVSLALANLRLREALQQQSVRDPLTGLFNRRYMEESLELELRRAARNSRSLGILMLDLDNFKMFNDSFGHDAGDTILREFGNLLKKGIRSCDIACRYGGEEFAVLLPEASLEVSRQRAEQLREEAKHLNAHHRLQSLGNVTVSIGIAAFPEHGDSVDKLLQAADKALYSAKLAGRDCVVAAASPPPE